MEVSDDNRTKRRKRATADWANLLPELLQLISWKLANICEYILFRSTCAAWRSAASPTDIQQNLPWLVIPSLGNRRTNTMCFFSLSDRRYLNFFGLPELQGKWICGSAHGWLLMLEAPSDEPASSRRTVSLHNPITRAKIQLPQLPKGLNSNVLRKTVLCSHPTSAQPGHVLVAISTSKNLVFFRAGDNDWSLVSWLEHPPPRDILFYDERIYMVDNLGNFSALEVDSLKVSHLIHPRRQDILHFARTLICTFHLIEAAGDLLLLACSRDNINVFKLNRSQDGVLNWTSLGFIDKTPSTKGFAILSVCGQCIPHSRGSRGHRVYVCSEASSSNVIAVIQIIDIVDGVGIIEQPSCHVPKRVWFPSQRFSPGVTLILPALH